MEDAPRRVRELQAAVRAYLMESMAKEPETMGMAAGFVEPRDRVILIGDSLETPAGKRSPLSIIGWSEETGDRARSAVITMYWYKARKEGEGPAESVAAIPTWYRFKEGKWVNQGKQALEQTWEKYPFGMERLPVTTMPATRP